MIPLPVSTLESLGTLDAHADEFTGVQVDSRRITSGDLFVGVGRGVEFVADAHARGAAATLVPEDAFDALAQIARHVRDRRAARDVGVTSTMG